MKSLTLKYRPSDFETVCGQSVTTTILKKAIEEGKFKNSMLFTGPSGCGKTTLARILANKINGVSDPKEKAYEERDAASNNGVDQVRTIIEEAKQRDLSYPYKVFIIDECHMISLAGWNAFLKGIEEAPTYTIYIFCTTEPSKLPATILNRVQRYNITKISTDEIRDRLALICQIEGYTNYNIACDFLSKLANGSMRTAITYLEQCADYSTDLSLDNVKAVLGDISAETMTWLANYLITHNEAQVISLIDKLYNEGRDLKVFLDQFLGYILDLTKYIYYKDLSITSIPAYLNEPGYQLIDSLIAQGCDINWLNYVADQLLDIKATVKYDDVYKATIEVYLLKICRHK